MKTEIIKPEARVSQKPRICKKHAFKPLISIIVISYNGGKYVTECLRSLEKSDYHQFELIIVDNASTDGSIDIIEASSESARIICLEKNVGYGAAANIGIAQAKGELVVVINQDVFVQKDWLSHLIYAYRQYGIAIYQPKILLASDSRFINTAGNTISLAGFTVLRGAGQSSSLFNTNEILCYASGACFMFHKSIIDVVGLFDSSFFMFKEDLDWGWRAILKGYKTVYVASAIVYHHWNVDRNLKMKLYFSERNRLATLTKNYSARTLAILVPFFLLHELFIIGFCIIEGLLKEKIKSYVDYLRLLPRVKRERVIVQNGRRVSDRDVLRHFTCDFEHIFLSPIGKSASKILGFVGKKLSRFV
jgi:GT2 family glycosyltransferase